ncbi:MAG: hypothetical protein K2L45_07835 [Muribaculaceae bacterium]|nr:hypothetical protein [Muribaculaceae bacterium]MDE6632549.1 hypothetical protein [Muribaculaceae bacterium]
MNYALIKRFIPIAVMALILLIPACGGKGKNAGVFPEGFASLSDEQKVAYMMEHVSADSVARFIIYASLGKVEGVRIDTLNNATLKAYETYTDTALQTFSWEFDRVSEELPLHDKMRLRVLVGTEDPQGLGLTLGLEYLNQIRVKGMGADEVLEELKELKRASTDDPDMYARFLIGFRTVLRYDKNSDMPKEIYTRFLNYDEDAVEEYYSRNKSAAPSIPVTLPDSIPIEEHPEAVPSDSI